MSEPRQTPYPADTKAKGWRFELDMEQIRQSDTWALASPAARPWLLMLWTTAWDQVPCGSMPADDELIAARIGLDTKAFSKLKTVLMRGWWLAADGRLYHDTIVARVHAMLVKKEKDRTRKAGWRAKKSDGKTRQSDGVPPESHGTDAGLTVDSDRKDGTKHQAPSTSINSEPNGSGADAPPPDPRDVVFALGVPLLTAAGVKESNARSFLAMQCKEHTDIRVAEALEACAVEKPIQPIPWLQAVLKPGAGRRKPTKHSGFAEKNYREGVTEDGTLV